MKIVLLIVIFLFMVRGAQSQTNNYPRAISYTGVLADSVGRPLHGRKTVAFTLVNKQGVAHPSAWKHTQVFFLNGGMFSTLLGDTTLGSSQPFPELQGTYFLSIKVTNEDGSSETLPPIAFTASAYSLYALDIADSSVTNSKILAGAVLTEKIRDGNVTEPKIADNAITNRTVQDRSIDSNKIRLRGISGANIQNRTISESKLTSTTAKIGDALTWNGASWVATSSIPVGVIIPYAGDENSVPSGWLLCNGQAVPDGNEYNQLRMILNSGNWNSSTVPDVRGMFLRGANPNSGTVLGQYQESTTALPRSGFQTSYDGGHRHSTQLFMNVGNGYSYNVAGGATDPTPFLTNPSNKYNTFFSSYDGAHYHSITGGDTETRPANISVNYIIKARP